MVKNRLAAIVRNKSIGPDDVLGKILKLCVVETMMTYLTRLLNIRFNNPTYCK